MSDPPIEAVLFDIDGTLITTGGAGATAWRRAFEELHGVGVDIREVTESGQVDTEVGAPGCAACWAGSPIRTSWRRRWAAT